MLDGPSGVSVIAQRKMLEQAKPTHPILPDAEMVEAPPCTGSIPSRGDLLRIRPFCMCATHTQTHTRHLDGRIPQVRARLVAVTYLDANACKDFS